MYFLIIVIAIAVLLFSALLYFVVRTAVKHGFIAGYCKVHRLNPQDFQDDD